MRVGVKLENGGFDMYRRGAEREGISVACWEVKAWIVGGVMDDDQARMIMYSKP